MIEQGLAAFAGRTVLLLQGPMGPFFSRLADDLRAARAHVRKVNFNAGDAAFYRRDAFAYRGTLAEWPRALEALIDRWSVDVVLLFGDCRPIHSAARDVVHRRNLELGVFEEGYIRPDYVTLERFGVNGHSRLPRAAGQYRNLLRSPPDRPQRVGNAYWHGVMWSVAYAAAATVGRPAFPHYEHHRPLGAIEATRWLRGAWRRVSCAFAEQGLQARLAGSDSQRYFLVPLQVGNDSQVRRHSPYADVPAFIEAVMISFAAYAPPDALLVIKHHPLDRPYSDHSSLIELLEARLGLRGRCLYVHDLHLPTLLTHARGVVLINSTVGLQALHHGQPTKACGAAIFNIQGLTYQGELDKFWTDTEQATPDAGLLQRFNEYVVETTQINGNFYRRIPKSPMRCGLRWARRPEQKPARDVEACVPNNSAFA